jgi:hypothetical protein
MASSGGRHRVSTGLGGICKITFTAKNTQKGGLSRYQNVKRKTDFSQVERLLDEQDSKLLEVAFEVDRKINQYLAKVDYVHSVLTHAEASNEYGKLYNRRRKFLEYGGTHDVLIGEFRDLYKSTPKNSTIKMKIIRYVAEHFATKE